MRTLGFISSCPFWAIHLCAWQKEELGKISCPNVWFLGLPCWSQSRYSQDIHGLSRCLSGARKVYTLSRQCSSFSGQPALATWASPDFSSSLWQSVAADDMWGWQWPLKLGDEGNKGTGSAVRPMESTGEGWMWLWDRSGSRCGVRLRAIEAPSSPSCLEPVCCRDKDAEWTLKALDLVPSLSWDT